MASTDEGCLLAKDEWAIVLSPDENKFSLYAPNMGRDAIVPPLALALTACFIRLDTDPGFRDECEQWFRDQKAA